MQTELPIDLSVLERRFFKDGPFLAEVLQNYKKTCEGCIDDLRQSVAMNDHQLQNKAVHKLRGSTLNFANNSLVEKLGAIENGTLAINSKDIDAIELEVKALIEKITSVVDEWLQSSGS